MPTYVVRVWMPDRAGALGAVASRIGSVRGDLVGIDILERGGGRVIDELAVDLPDTGLVPLLVREIAEVDGVDVEDVRPAVDFLADPRLDALETAAALVAQADVAALLGELAARSVRDFEADWGAVVDLAAAAALGTAATLGAGAAVAKVGAVPPEPWLEAFAGGSRASAGSEAADGGPDDVAWADMGCADLILMIGRRGRPFRARERRQVAALARIADHRWMELAPRPFAATHPAAVRTGRVPLARPPVEGAGT